MRAKAQKSQSQAGKTSAGKRNENKEPIEHPFNGGQTAVKPSSEAQIVEGKEEPNGSSKKRGSRLPAGWTLPDDWRAWALTEGMDATAIDRECGKFRNYWISVPGAKGSKISWYATWQNWIWKAIEDRAPKSRPVIDPDADIYRGVMYSQ